MYGALSHDAKITVLSNAVAAGTSTITPSAGIDMAGYTGCLIIVVFGAITAGAATSIKCQGSSDDAAADSYADLTGTSVTVADDKDNKAFYLDIIEPVERYIKPIVLRATQNAAVETIIAIQYGASRRPTTHSTTVSTGELHQGEAEGTA